MGSRRRRTADHRRRDGVRRREPRARGAGRAAPAPARRPAVGARVLDLPARRRARRLAPPRQPGRLAAAARGTRLGARPLCAGYVGYEVLHPGALPTPGLAAWVLSWIWAVGLAGLPLLLALFPDGLWPGRRWRLVGVGALAALALLFAGSAFEPGPLADVPWLENPVGIDGLEVLGGDRRRAADRLADRRRSPPSRSGCGARARSSGDSSSGSPPRWRRSPPACWPPRCSTRSACPSRSRATSTPCRSPRCRWRSASRSSATGSMTSTARWRPARSPLWPRSCTWRW